MANELLHFEALEFLAVTRTVGEVLGEFQWVVAVWLFCVGACFGSLLNVIVYRWPAGMSIVVPRSRCPRCGHAIRIYDNVPVLNWLILRGRCRDCRAPISGRYPAVEAMVGLVFLALALVEVFPRETSLARGREHQATIVWIEYAAHLVLLYSMMAAALIQYDGKRVPLLVYFPALIAGVLLPIFVQLLGGESDWSGSLATSAGGVVVGGLFACLTKSAVGRDWQHGQSHLLLLLLCGLILRWPAVVMISFCFSVFTLWAVIERCLRPHVTRFPAAGFLTISVLAVLIYWSALDNLVTWFSGDHAWATLIVSAPIVLGISIVARRLEESGRRTNVAAGDLS